MLRLRATAETAQQEQCFLPAHAAAECVHAATIDPKPRDGMFRDLWHPGKVADLAGVTP